jgi:hypothetical protein
VFKGIRDRLNVSDLILVLGIGLIALLHTSFERTLYYWDFGDYQRNLIQLHHSAKDGFQAFLTQLWEYQNSEYPVSWAGPFALFPFFSFENRAAFSIMLSTIGIFIWAKATQAITFKIFVDRRVSNIALILFCTSAGPWMLALRGWPDVIASGLVWLGFAKSFKSEKTENFFWGVLIMALGLVMRKTLTDLVFCLFLMSFVSNLKKSNFDFYKIPINRHSANLLLPTTLLILWVAINPGFIKSTFVRNNSDFYKPFQVTFQEYINNLVSINGMISIFLCIVFVSWSIYMKVYKHNSNYLVFALFPLLYTLIWMLVFRQATDHHMVQWVPVYSTLGIATLVYATRGLRFGFIIRILTILISCLSLSLTLISQSTPFASPSNPFMRPFPHSVAPVVRNDYNELQRLKTALTPITASGQSIISLNESHEFNQGLLKSMFLDKKLQDLKILPIGSMDFRDDPGFRNLFEADFVLAPDPFIPLIPKFQKTLEMINMQFQNISFRGSYWSKIASFDLGDTASKSNWWSADYAKKRTFVTLYKRVETVPELVRQKFVLDIYDSLYGSDTKLSSIQLISGPDSSFGASLSNNQNLGAVLEDPIEKLSFIKREKKIRIASKCGLTVRSIKSNTQTTLNNQENYTFESQISDFIIISLFDQNLKNCSVRVSSIPH